jgi:hypothetical protein
LPFGTDIAEELAVAIAFERIKMPKRRVNWNFLKFIARIESY